jgi:DNA-binding HxlR family transcriptional regulator
MARALDLVGERWALLVVRELLLGPKRFTDLRDGLPNASPNVLSERLHELEQAGIVRRRKLPPPASAWVYELTEWGAELEGVVIALGRWALRAPCQPPKAEVGPDSVLVAFKSLFDPAAARGLRATIALVLDGCHCWAQVERRQLAVGHGELDDPDAAILADPTDLGELLGDPKAFSAAVRAGRVKVFGDKHLAGHFIGLFPLPRPAQTS